ncbi:MAG TPA: NADPH-dependent FMN reductase [Fibrobacteria bacterium]|nr:NADPH-dependent FMN reductase [Fibrobacteria bacterium]
MRILGISGSLRENSSNTTLLKLMQALPHPGIEFEIYGDLGRLPFFSPELDDADASGPVREFRALLKRSDGVVLSTPEYAFGMPGVLKNALDWTVSSGEFDKKPVAALSASPTSAGGDKAHASLLLVLSALSARVVPEASFAIPAIYKRISKTGAIADPGIVDVLSGVLSGLVGAIKNRPAD